jgi:hypothetical protein
MHEHGNQSSSEHKVNKKARVALTEKGRQALISTLNDALRSTGVGGQILITRGIAALGETAVREILMAVAAFNDFGPDNDPWNEHDCAVLSVDGVRIIWKIDYYDLSGRFLSPDPADPKVTRRVLTVMRADEY